MITSSSQINISIMHIILGLVFFCAVYWFLTKDTKPAPPVMTLDQLMEEGMTAAEARRELRAQRQEHRTHSITHSQALRTANSLTRTASKMIKR